MKIYVHKHTVRYHEVDRMGIVHHGNYIKFLEDARIEYFKFVGISYKALEDSGIFLPVRKLDIEYLRPIQYDDTVEIETKIERISPVRIVFSYEVWNQERDTLHAKAGVMLAFVDKNGKVIKHEIDLGA
ncbi:MAG: thioesterase family protein [Fusobacteria bacterium]|nr:thioesterase family protein [Fusobacteriota bacterium]